jgi:hypothetical protein
MRRGRIPSLRAGRERCRAGATGIRTSVRKLTGGLPLVPNLDPDKRKYRRTEQANWDQHGPSFCQVTQQPLFRSLHQRL